MDGIIVPSHHYHYHYHYHQSISHAHTHTHNSHTKWLLLLLLPSTVKFEENKGHAYDHRSRDGSGCGFLKYLIVRPEKGGLGDLPWRHTVWADVKRGMKFLESSELGSDDDESSITGLEAADDRCLILVSTRVRKQEGCLLWHGHGEMDEEPNRTFVGLTCFIPEHMSPAYS